MERQHFIMFILGAASLAVGIVLQPYVNALWQWIKSSIPRKQPANNIQEQIDDLQSQIHNLIEVKYNRETNRKNNIRRDVREYLSELRSDK